MFDKVAVCARIEEQGFALLEGVLSESEVGDLRAFVEAETASAASRGGVRNFLDSPKMLALAESPTLQELVKPVLGPEARVVRGIFFDKTGAANWKVPWHQDMTIEVSRRIEAEGYGPWSIKSGIQHVQPPAEILEKMISVRIHLDDCPEENGALRVIPRSHLSGKLPANFEGEGFDLNRAVICAMKSGGALLMRPLLLHASSAAQSPSHRRVIHFDYASARLPQGMEWAVAQA